MINNYINKLLLSNDNSKLIIYFKNNVYNNEKKALNKNNFKLHLLSNTDYYNIEVKNVFKNDVNSYTLSYDIDKYIYTSNDALLVELISIYNIDMKILNDYQDNNYIYLNDIVKICFSDNETPQICNATKNNINISIKNNSSSTYNNSLKSNNNIYKNQSLNDTNPIFKVNVPVIFKYVQPFIRTSSQDCEIKHIKIPTSISKIIETVVNIPVYKKTSTNLDKSPEYINYINKSSPGLAYEYNLKQFHLKQINEYHDFYGKRVKVYPNSYYETSYNKIYKPFVNTNTDINKIILNPDDPQIVCLNNISKMNVIFNNDNKYLFNNLKIYNPTIKYSLYNGTYQIINIPIGYPIAILNSGIENEISYTGDNNKNLVLTISNVDRPGTYNFYYGNITINVNSNFNQVSIYSYYYGYMGGENLFIYNLC